MTKYSKLSSCSKYGSVHSVNVSSDSSFYEPKKNVNGFTTIDTHVDKANKTGEFSKSKYKRKDFQKEPLITGRIKRAVDKIQNIAQEKKEKRFPSDDSDEIIHIRLPTSDVEDEPVIPKEVGKTFIALLIMLFNFTLNLTALAVIHEYVPDSDKYDPLPDIIINNVPAQDWALDVAEYVIMATVMSVGCLLGFHKYKYIVFRRIFLIMGLLYLMRAITMSVTVLPVPSRTYNCSPKLNSTDFVTIAKRVANLMSGLGLSVNGKHIYCGDYIYSGHTVILVMCWLLVTEYTPKVFFVVHWLYGLAAFAGVVMVLIAHGHYTLDVLIGYFITTRVFWIYHTMANNSFLKNNHQYNYLSRTWCFRIFQYFEENVQIPLPSQFNWPKRFHR